MVVLRLLKLKSFALLLMLLLSLKDLLKVLILVVKEGVLD